MIGGAFLCSIQVTVHQHRVKGFGHRTMWVSIYIHISKFCAGLFGVEKDLFHDVCFYFQFVQSKRPVKQGR